MIHIDPAIIYERLMEKSIKLQERYAIVEAKVQKQWDYYKALPWYKRMWVNMPKGYEMLMVRSGESFEHDHRNLIRVCEHAIQHGHKTIYLPLEYGWLLAATTTTKTNEREE